MKARLRSFSVFLALAIPSFAAAENLNPCVAVYANATKRIDFDSAESATYAFVYKNACSTANREIRGRLDVVTQTIVNNIPSMGKLFGSAGYKSNKQFCEAAQRTSMEVYAGESLRVEPLDHAERNFNQCMAIYNESKAEIQHVISSPGQVVISITVPENYMLEIQGVTSRDFKCAVPNRTFMGLGSNELGPDTPLKLTKSDTITCLREPADTSKGGFKYPLSSITIGTSSGKPYDIQIPADQLFGPFYKSEADRAIAAADSARLASENTASMLVQQMNQARLESKAYYYGEVPLKPERHGVNFGCNVFLNKDKRDEIVESKLCPNADAVKHTRHYSSNGGYCGYYFHTLACLYYPKKNKAEP